MSTQTPASHPKLGNNLAPQEAPNTPPTKRRSPATMAARRQASARYREKNLEEERDKARERMARHRARVKGQDELAEEFRARARAASRTFRAKNAKNLAHRQRIIRMEAYGKKHGHRAWLERQQLQEERRAEARELEEDRKREEELRRILGPQL
ncbi:hypothetical protein B0H13DRAFT_2328586 [Mycena leptocephala]|nr:hypothetical protein B0H13DRAFT_2328586 [Mycena leptocephala]